MKLAIEYLEPFLLEASQKKDMPVVVIATVEGDIHDIGKNLVALMLKNYGFQVIDLGKDVPKEVIVEEAIKNKAKIIALSALMTTTMQEMKRVVAYAKEKGAQAKIMIGGAVITGDWCGRVFPGCGGCGEGGKAPYCGRIKKSKNGKKQKRQVKEWKDHT